jgi:hypothetical protein
MKEVVKASELVALIKWCNYANGNEDFWRRWLVSIAVYPPEKYQRLLQVYRLFWPDEAR